jgi:uncharacterized protein (TIGR03437 family)
VTVRAATVTVASGTNSVSADVQISPGSAPVLVAPSRTPVVAGGNVAFTVSATDPTGTAITLSASGLPGGASFDASSGQFSWTPPSWQQGEYAITWKAVNGLGASAAASSTLIVDGGKPVVAAFQNAATASTRNACSPGSLASLTGRWLAASEASDASGNSLRLGGARVSINGSYVPVVYASPERIDFVCPSLAVGTLMAAVVQNSSGVSDATYSTMHASHPWLFSTDKSGTGQGSIQLTASALTAMSRSYLTSGQPAAAGDSITILATGFDESALPPLVSIGGQVVQATALAPSGTSAGVWEITVTVPQGVSIGDAISVNLPGLEGARALSNGSVTRGLNTVGAATLQSNTVTMAVESLTE